jgi:hypothetical protein
MKDIVNFGDLEPKNCKMKKKWPITLVVLAGLIFAGYRYIYKPHRDIGSEDPAFVLSAKKLQDDFSADQSAANAKYADKTIEVSGVVTDFDASSHMLSLDSVISVTLQDSTSTAVPGTQEHIKARLVGYDDILKEVKMDQASILK